MNRDETLELIQLVKKEDVITYSDAIELASAQSMKYSSIQTITQKPEKSNSSSLLGKLRACFWKDEEAVVLDSKNDKQYSFSLA